MIYERLDPSKNRFATVYEAKDTEPVVEIREIDLNYVGGFKPGDKIFIEPSQGYPNGNYVIGNDWYLINERTGMQASNPIQHANKEYATWDEVNNTHGILGFTWCPL